MLLSRFCLGLALKLSLIGHAASNPLAPSNLGPQDDEVNTAKTGDLPTIIPGPGLPSLKSLGITTADLVNPAWLKNHAPAVYNATIGLSEPSSSGSLHRRAANCVSWRDKSYKKSHALACAAYVQNLGTKLCKVTKFHTEATIMCAYGDKDNRAFVSGSGERGTAASYCSQVAHAVRVVVAGCRAEKSL